MGFFTRKSKFDLMVDAASSAARGGALRNVGKLGAGVVAGVASLTAVSAAISSARHQEQQ